MLRRFKLDVIFILGVLLLSSCALPLSAASAPDVDKDFDAAVAKAHSTLNTVRQALVSPKPSYVYIGLKIRIHNASTFEDIWTEPVDYYNGAFTTQMVEGVTVSQGYHPNNLVRVPVEDVIDWMIVEEDGTLIGGYTIRLAYRNMTPEEREEFLRITGYKAETLLEEE
ncbi:MAG: DUF2314 domain-containing protein [Chloroflexi bacterium]|nr:DUF2314 domain-containing protein [Chloroflexota bacterium]MBI5704925.1 DUF2314 domain-containing protein [Chloroflexota bacterium]